MKTKNYKIEVSTDRLKWLIYKRFSEFEKLHQNVIDSFGFLSLVAENYVSSHFD
jgi:hypothetical protein